MGTENPHLDGLRNSDEVNASHQKSTSFTHTHWCHEQLTGQPRAGHTPGGEP